MSNSRRRSIHVEGLGHGGQPIPNACRIGGLLWSGGVNGIAPGARDVPGDSADEATQMFANVRAIVTAGGGTLEDVIRVSVFVRDRAETRDAINSAWLATFPEADSRPARHLTVHELQPPLRMQCEFIAVVEEAP